MKKIFFSMMALSIAAFTFTACEDVPEPYNNPYDSIKPSEPEVVIEAKGSGTATDPWNVAAALKESTSLGADEQLNGGNPVVVTGIITQIDDIDTGQYGNATYYISDDIKGSNRLEIYRGFGLNGDKFTEGNVINEGDTVTVSGVIVNFRGNTLEFTTGSKLLSIKKGGGSGETPATPGTEEAPLTVAQALVYIDGLGADKQSPVGFVKGKIAAISEIDTGNYGNATYTISDDGKDENTLQVYRGYSLDGAKFTSADEIKVGDEVIVSGKLVNYKGNTKQFAQGSKIVSLNGKTSGEDKPDTPNVEGQGKGTADAPYNVTAAIAAGEGTGVYVKAFIVGSIDGKSTTDAKFSAETATASNILIAASADETDITKCMPVQLPAGNVRTALNLVDNAGNYKKEVTLYGNIEKYFSVVGLKSVTFAIIDGKEIGTNPGGGSNPDTPSGDEVKAVTIAEFNAAAESNDVWYKLTGTIKNLKDGDQYGNFDLEDETGSVYVYGVLSEKGGAKKLFQELVSKYNLKDGVTITIIGTRGSYNGKIEVMNAYFVSVGGDNNGGNNGGGEAGTGADGSKVVSIADFNAAPESNDVWYQLTGTVKNLKDGDQYGNFDLEDASGSVYVYGLLSEKGGAKKQFQTLATEKGIQNGSTLTIVGTRGSYNGKIEVMNAYFISVK